MRSALLVVVLALAPSVAPSVALAQPEFEDMPDIPETPPASPGDSDPGDSDSGSDEPGGEEALTEPPVEPAPVDQPAVGPVAAGEPGETELPVDPPAVTDDSADRMRVLVVDAATYGIDPVVGRLATERIREASAAAGYTVLSRQQTVAAAQQLRMPYPPTPADLWRVSWVARVHRGIFALIGAHGGHYVIEIAVASLDGGGPFFARGTAGAEDLREVLDRLIERALPSPSQWNAAGAQQAGTVLSSPGGTGGRAPPSSNEPPGPRIDELDDFDEPAPRPAPEPTEPEPELRRWQLSIQTEGAIGASSDFYYNHLIGARLDFRITRDILLGVYFAYANLNARNGRADNIYFALQFENRIRISSDLDLTIPLRAQVGYLPFNGPVIRVSAGLNYAFTPDFEMGLDLLAPTFWILPDRVAVSLNVALEGTARF